MVHTTERLIHSFNSCLILGKRVLLSEHSGYRGGLDTQFGQTGEYTFYTTHQDKEIMFHVATQLPYSETDSQQLQRKRHIGNDIVSIVFQEGSTPFSPDMVTSHFLHSYIVVTPLEGGDRYRVSVTARADVPYFGPSLPSPPIFRRGPEFREWLLCKLINAETACYKAEKFSKLEQRTRTSLLSNLVEELTSKTSDFLGIPPTETATKPEKTEESGGLFKSVKKAFANRTKSSAVPDSSTTNNSSNNKSIPKSKSSSSGFSEHNGDDSGGSGTAGTAGKRSGGLLSAQTRRGAKSDSGRGSVGTGSVTSSTGRGSSPISSSSSPDLTARLGGSVAGGGTIHSESDTSSLNSMEYDQSINRISPKKRASMSGKYIMNN